MHKCQPCRVYAVDWAGSIDGEKEGQVADGEGRDWVVHQASSMGWSERLEGVHTTVVMHSQSVVEFLNATRSVTAALRRWGREEMNGAAAWLHGFCKVEKLVR